MPTVKQDNSELVENNNEIANFKAESADLPMPPNEMNVSLQNHSTPLNNLPGSPKFLLFF